MPNNFDLIYDRSALNKAVAEKFGNDYKPKKKKAKPTKKFRGQGKYKRYIASQEWVDRKDQFRASHSTGRCEICYTKSNLIIHHHNYRRVSRELDSDLALLCKGCHHSVHFSPDGTKVANREKILRARYLELKDKTIL